MDFLLFLKYIFILIKFKERISTSFILKVIAPGAGFEPATSRLTAARSTTELPRNKILKGTKSKFIIS